DSLVSGKSSKERTVKVDGEEVAASSKTPSEFISGSRKTSGIAFNKAFLERMGYSDPAALVPRKNTSGWSNLSLKGVGGSSKASSELSDNGSTPSAPSGLSHSGNKLSWSKASGQMIVGYQVYHAKEDGGSFKAVGHTTGSSVSVSGSGGAFHVRAVNYFGRESSPSKTIVLKASKKENEKKDKEKDKDNNENEKKDKKEKEKDKKEDEKKKKEAEKKAKEEAKKNKKKKKKKKK